jgi:serine/threonine protein phosphatase PrpC
VASSVGVTSIPECQKFTLTSQDKVLVLASDGVWEFLSNEEVAAILFPFYIEQNAEKAGEALVRAAFKRWKTQHAGSVDDITCIIVFLKI